MRLPIAFIHVLVLVALGMPACMPTDVDYMPPPDIDGDSQMLSGDIIIRSQSDARSLPKRPFSVAGDVEVVNSDLTDLEPLAYLRQANVLRIQGNRELQTMAGLDRVRVVEHVHIDDNELLGDVLGLDKTELVTRVMISKNPRLLSLEGLRSVKRIGGGGLTISDNESLEQIRDLEALERIEGPLRIERNSGLLNLETARKIESVVDVVVTNNNGLISLKLDVGTVANDVVITDNRDLGTFAAFGSLASIGRDLTIQNNPGLTIIDGFTASFQTIGRTLKIENNDALTDAYLLSINLFSVGGSVIVVGNNILSDCRAQDFDLLVDTIGGFIDIGDNSPEYDPCYD